MNKHIYEPTDQMSSLISAHPSMLIMLQCFEVAMGFGEKTIEEICDEYKLNTNALLDIANTLINSEYRAKELSTDKDYMQALVLYIKKSYAHFLQVRFSNIRQDLETTLDFDSNEISIMIMRHFDEYVERVYKHMNYEEAKLFPYISDLLHGVENNYSIVIFQKLYDNIDKMLTELIVIIIKYYKTSNNWMLNKLLLDMFACANDMAQHSKIEQQILIPAVKALENNHKTN